MKKKIHLLTIHPTHYHDFFFRALNEDPDIDLKVHFLQGLLGNYPWQTEMRQGYNSRICKKTFGLDFELIKSIWNDKNALFFIAGWENSVKISTILLCILWNRKFVVGTDTPNFDKKRSDLKASFRHLWISFIAKKCFRFVSTGNPGLEGLIQMGVEKSKIDSLPFFVDLDYFKPLPEFLKNDKIIIFSSGRLVNSHKGFDQAIKVLDKVKKTNPNTDFVYQIAGQGSDKEILEHLIVENNLGQEVQLLGWKEPHEILELYQSCDIFLHPSHFDPFPNAVLEAMACGAFTIASASAGSAKDRVTNNENGLLFDDADLKIFYTHLNWAFQSENKEKIVAMRKSARKSAEKHPVQEGVLLLKKYLMS